MAATTGYALLALCVAGETGRELCFKRAATGTAPLLRRPALWGGLVLWAAELPLWVLVLGHIALAIALPLMALSFATVPLAAQLILRERLRPRQLLGVALIGVGTVCVGFSGVAA